MEKCSYFIENKALFGSFPTQETVNLLEDNGVRCFIDLTNGDESKITPYITRYKYIKYPILDQKIPEHWKSFAQLIVKICQVIHSLHNDEKVYVHCKGGHGRSGILVACIFCHYYGLNPDQALRQTSVCHSKRLEMRDKWRKLGSPQGRRQRDFVHKFFKPLQFSEPELLGYSKGFHNFSPYTVTIPNVGVFQNAHLAFLYFKDPDNHQYVTNLLNGKYTESQDKNNVEWEEKKIEYMYSVLDYKFNQHHDIRHDLTNTGLRPLIKISQDSFWGIRYDGHGKNIFGKLLEKLRIKYLLEEFDQIYDHVTEEERTEHSN